MERMVRKQIYISRQQDARLKRLAKRRGVSEAEVIRQALEIQIGGLSASKISRNPEAFEKAYQFMLARRQLAPAGAAYRWSREDAYAERLSRYDKK